MFRIQINHFLRIFALISTLVSALAVVSCGGGSGVTAGVGGSGIGGTGITLVRGNVATVVAVLENSARVRMLAGIIDLFSRSAIAQPGEVDGIVVSGGGQTDVTDEQGRFELIEVTPSSNFVITLTLQDGQVINLGIGSVPPSSAVQVNNIVVDARQGNASPSSVEVEDNSSSSGDDNSDDDSGSGSSGSGGSDDDSTSSSGNSGPGGGADDDDSSTSNSGSGSGNSGSGSSNSGSGSGSSGSGSGSDDSNSTG